MSFMEDDFYTAETSSRGWKEGRFSSGGHRSRGRIVGVIAASMVSGAMLAFLSIPFFLGNGSSDAANRDEARAAIVMDAKASYNDMVILAAERVNPAVVSVINGQKPVVDAGGTAGNDAREKDAGEGAGKSESAEDADADGIEPVGLGSGVIFHKGKEKAYIVTNNHVVENADKVEIILISGEHKLARVVGTDKTTDLAVLEVDGRGITAVAEFGDSDLLRAGETAIAIGNPLGLVFSQTITMGIISSPHRTVPVTVEGNMDWEMDFIQTDAAINQGNSGGALVNLDGQVIGINSMKVSFTGVEGLGFAIPINEAKPVIESLMQFGKVKRVFLGISHQDLQSYAEGTEVLNLPKGVIRGIIVMEAQGPAKKAGLKGKDVIVEMDGIMIDSSLTMRKYLYSKKKIGDEVEIGFYRDGKKMRVMLELVEKE